MAKRKRKTIDLNGFTKIEVKRLIKAEGYSEKSFYNIWKNKKMRVTIIKNK